MYAELAVLALFIFGYSIVAGRVERAAASGPIVFVAAGFIMGPLGFAWFDGDLPKIWLRILADLTLATILFIDAANADKDYDARRDGKEFVFHATDGHPMSSSVAEAGGIGTRINNITII